MNTQTLPSEKTSPAQFSEDRKINVVLKSVVHDIQGYASHLEEQIQELSSIGKALSSVNDLGELLGTIVDKARAFTHADAGTLYLKEGNALKFSIFQNDTLKIRLGGKNQGAITYPPIALDDSSISSYVALNGKTVNIPDVYVSKLADFTGPKKFDLATGYRTQSMLVVILKNHENDTIGVLQLINSKDPKTGETVPFSHHAEHLTESLASQAAVAISNVRLIRDMENLFEAFVKVMATAIDEKSPVTGGHIRRVAHLTLTMAAVVHHQDNGVFKNTFFSEDQMHELRIASWMHDIGKVTTPVEIIEKATKLQTIFDRVHHIRLRMDYLIQKTKNDGLEQKIELMRSQGSQSQLDQIERQTMAKLRELAEIRSFITQCNEPKEYLEDSKVERLKAIAQRTYFDDDGVKKPFLTQDELENLSVRKGSITEAERKIMKEHAYMTLKMLQQIPFTKKFRNIPHYAGAHHECIDGSGYPLGLKGDEIPFAGKLMAVTDIAEALTSAERPYKEAMPQEEVNRILRAMAQKGKLDPELVELFINKNVYEIYKRNYEPNSLEDPKSTSCGTKGESASHASVA